MAGRLNTQRMARPARRRAAVLLLAGVVVALHLVIAAQVADQLLQWRATSAMPPRLQAAFVRELVPAAPPAVVPAAPPPAPRPRRARAPRPAAPSPAVAVEPAVAPVDAAASQAAAIEPAASAPDSPTAEPPAARVAVEPAAVLPAAPAASAVAAPAFDWPASTRLNYVLTGYYRGEMHGAAQVEWLRQDDRYQVHLDVTVGLPFAPLFARRMSSDGLIGAAGLAPRRYDEETRRAFAAPRRASMRFDGDVVVLANGLRAASLPGMQDTASQFVQLVWLFTLQPELLRAGGEVEMPLALPRGVDRWIYDVLGEETVDAPFGAVPAYHLKPRRIARPGSLAVETWIAPTLQYLPVRIRIHQDADTFIDLMIEKPPLQAAPAEAQADRR